MGIRGAGLWNWVCSSETCGEGEGEGNVLSELHCGCEAVWRGVCFLMWLWCWG